MQPPLTPCLVCEKAVIYLLPGREHKPDDHKLANLNGAAHIVIDAGYGSNFDGYEFEAILCDDCLDKVVQSKRVTPLVIPSW